MARAKNTVSTQENAVGASEKCQILCKNLQKLSKNEKFHKILQENYIFCAKTALVRDKSRWRAPTPVCANCLQWFLRASTTYEHPDVISDKLVKSKISERISGGPKHCNFLNLYNV